jgi:hypothetical protein
MQPLPPQSQYPAQPQPSWWSRNWKWAAPVGCLVLLLPILAIGGFIGGIVAIVFGSIKSTDVAQEALQRAVSNPVVIEALGAPVEDGWWVAGQIKTTGPSGFADIMIPLQGSRTEGKLYAVARKSSGRWTYETMEVEVDGQDERIDLLTGPE